jgi:hypothetical protein
VTRAGRATLYDLGAYNPDSEATNIEWQIDEWQVKTQIHLTVGEEKRGKSTQAWRRVEAVSRGSRYLDRYQAQAGHVVVVTEMDDKGVLRLIEDDDIEPDWSQIRTVFLDEYQPQERLLAIKDACAEWKPALLVLDPIDECLGLDDKGVFNPATTSEGFDFLRTLARSGVTIDGLYHYNNLGKIANSYKFRSKPDHIFTIRGSDASDVTIEYVGRLRAIPRKRRIQGNGQDGYEVTTLIANFTGRPAKSQQQALDCLQQADGFPLAVAEIAKRTGLHYHAARRACDRLVERELAIKIDGTGAYRVRGGASEAVEDPAV